jgi:hypothetical protein
MHLVNIMEKLPMAISLRYPVKITALAFLFAVSAVPNADAQNLTVRPNQNQNAANISAAYNIGAVQGASSSAGFNNLAYPSPYYGGYYPAVGAALSGVSDIISSQGQFLIQNEQSWIMHEKQKQEKINTRRMTFDEKMYEQANTPSSEDLREKARVTSLRRSLNNPPQGEIWSGVALNTILEALQRDSVPVSLRPIIPLSADTLAHINATSGATAGSIGLIKDGGKLPWPLSLKRGDFGSDRGKMDELASKALVEAGRGTVQPETVQEMTSTLENMREALKQRVDDIPISDYMSGKRFLTELEDTISALQDPNISKQVSRSWSKANSVSELVEQLTRQGLKFAAATPGDEPSYSSLYQSFVAFTSGLSQLRAQKPPQQ